MPVKLLAICLLLCSSIVFATDIKSVEGEGRFVPSNEDSAASIKEQLLSSALRDIVTKEMREMGLDSDLYWKKYDEKFEEYFRPMADNLKKSLKVEDGKSSPQYLRSLRAKRMSSYNKFGRLDRAMVGFSDRGVTRNPARPDERVLILNARIDRKVLAQIYARLTTVTNYKKITTLYLTFVPVLESVTWQEMGVNASTDFTNLVEENWHKYLSSETKSETHPVTIEIVPPAQMARLEEILKRPPSIAQEQKNADNNSAWLRIQFFVRKIQDDEKTKECQFQVSGDFVMIDLSSHQTLLYADIPSENVAFSYADGHNLSSNLASKIYRMPMLEWANISKVMSSIPIRNGLISIKVGKPDSLADVLAFNDYINIRAASFRPEAVLEQFNAHESIIQFRFAGDIQKLEELLVSLNNQQINDNLKLVIADKENPFSVSLVRTNERVKYSAESNDFDSAEATHDSL